MLRRGEPGTPPGGSLWLSVDYSPPPSHEGAGREGQGWGQRGGGCWVGLAFGFGFGFGAAPALARVGSGVREAILLEGLAEPTFPFFGLSCVCRSLPAQLPGCRLQTGRRGKGL